MLQCWPAVPDSQNSPRELLRWHELVQTRVLETTLATSELEFEVRTAALRRLLAAEQQHSSALRVAVDVVRLERCATTLT